VILKKLVFSNEQQQLTISRYCLRPILTISICNFQIEADGKGLGRKAWFRTSYEAWR